MELEEGMYVRTDSGYIFKLGYYDKKEKRWMYFVEEDWYPVYESESELAKVSHNIIDLIQENDFVNGEKVSSIQYDGMGFEHIRCVQTICKFDDLDNQFYTETYFNKDIKSIVTKEQFERMSYKVGE